LNSGSLSCGSSQMSIVLEKYKLNLNCYGVSKNGKTQPQGG
jgi:hypothetical protein